MSHWDNLRGLTTAAPREYLLYNYYYNPGKGVMDSNDFFKGAPGAVRNARYKLMHTYDSTTAGTWFKASQVSDNGDDNLQEKGGCTQAAAAEGQFTYFLFDLDNDPNETTNLYDSDDKDITLVTMLYFNAKAADIQHREDLNQMVADNPKRLEVVYLLPKGGPAGWTERPDGTRRNTGSPPCSMRRARDRSATLSTA